MPDKQITVAVPEERVPEFYAWFAHFLAADAGEAQDGRPRRGRGLRGGGFGGGPGRRHAEPAPWSGEDAEAADWLYGRLAPPARRLFDRLAQAPGARVSGNDLAAELGLDKGAHGVAGILAWPGRYCRHLGRAMPIATEGRADGGTDYYMDPDIAALFAAAAAGGAQRA